jgi:phosphate-selective porin
MRRFLTGVLLLCALVVITSPVLAGEVEDLTRMVQELKKEVADLRADRALEASSVEKAVDDYLTRRAAGEGSGEMAGYMDGKFGLGSAEGDFGLSIGGGIVFDLDLFECDGLQDNSFDIGLVRLDFSGHVFDNWFFRIQPEFYTSGVALRDAYIQTDLGSMAGGTGNDYFDGLKLRFGQFKMPFSMSALEGDYDIDMAHRPLAVSLLAPSRDIGFQLSNTVMDGALTYALAISNGTNAYNNSDEFWYWARVVAAPFTGDDAGMFKNLHFGVNFGTSWGKEDWTPGLRSAGGGPYGVVGESGDYAYYDYVYPTIDTAGRQILCGFEFLWWWQQWAFKAECLHAMQEVNEEPESDDYYSETLSSEYYVSSMNYAYGPSDEVVTHGGYAQVAYMITGEDWSEAPSAGLEGVFRFDYVNIDWGGDSDDGDIMSWSLGLNYYFNKNVRAMFNYVATDYGDDSLRPIEKDGEIRGGGLDHNIFFRLQLTF